MVHSQSQQIPFPLTQVDVGWCMQLTSFGKATMVPTWQKTVWALDLLTTVPGLCGCQYITWSLQMVVCVNCSVYRTHGDVHNEMQGRTTRSNFCADNSSSTSLWQQCHSCVDHSRPQLYLNRLQQPLWVLSTCMTMCASAMYQFWWQSALEEAIWYLNMLANEPLACGSWYCSYKCLKVPQVTKSIFWFHAMVCRHHILTLVIPHLAEDSQRSDPLPSEPCVCRPSCHASRASTTI